MPFMIPFSQKKLCMSQKRKISLKHRYTKLKWTNIPGSLFPFYLWRYESQFVWSKRMSETPNGMLKGPSLFMYPEFSKDITDVICASEYARKVWYQMQVNRRGNQPGKGKYMHNEGKRMRGLWRRGVASSTADLWPPGKLTKERMKKGCDTVTSIFRVFFIWGVFGLCLPAPAKGVPA